MQSAAPTAAELQQLVAPIALYPDSLVAQIPRRRHLPGADRGSEPVAATERRLRDSGSPTKWTSNRGIRASKR
jgi:hypothetical protein